MVVAEEGQLYTIEGVAAALIMLVTAYLVVNATSVYTAGDTHISDMQLETLGNDALTVMGTPIAGTLASSPTNQSVLQSILEGSNKNRNFKENFSALINNGVTDPDKGIQFVANYTCSNNSYAISSLQPLSNSTHTFTGTEHSVRVTKWVIAQTACPPESVQRRAVLVEVLLWRD